MDFFNIQFEKKKANRHLAKTLVGGVGSSPAGLCPNASLLGGKRTAWLLMLQSGSPFLRDSSGK
jgi:hypothetical protein